MPTRLPGAPWTTLPRARRETGKGPRDGALRWGVTVGRQGDSMDAPPSIEGYSDLVRLAEGGFGVVYRAEDRRFERVVALKVLTVDHVDDRARQRFEHECRAMGRLSWHPNVVAVYDTGATVEGRPWLAMEYLDAGSLADRLRHEGPLPWTDVAAIGVQVAGALGSAHRSGVLHRDLKPENLLVGRSVRSSSGTSASRPSRAAHGPRPGRPRSPSTTWPPRFWTGTGPTNGPTCTASRRRSTRS